MDTYKCSNCKKAVKNGDKFCSGCGIKLEWPKEEPKIAKVEVIKAKKPKKVKKLNVDPLAVDDLYESSAGLAIGVLFTNILIIGLFLCPIIFIMRKTLKKWLQHLLHPESYPEINTATMVQKVKYIQSCGNITRLMGVGLFLFFIVNITRGYTSDRLGKSLASDSSGWLTFLTFATSMAGIIIGEVLVIKARRVIRSFNSGQKYEFDRDKKYNSDDYYRAPQKNESQDIIDEELPLL